MADYQRAVRAAPESATAFAGLGEAYLARARETGDPVFYSRAERAFDAALRRDPDDLGALIGAGNLAGLRHDFREQLRLGRLAVAEAPGLARPYTVLADAQIELGRYPDAADSIQRVVDVKPGLAAYSRASYYRELHRRSRPAPSRRCGLRPRPAARPRASPTSRRCSAISSSDAEMPGRRATAYRVRSDRCRVFPQALVGLARLDAAGGDLGGPPPACVEPRSGCR